MFYSYSCSLLVYLLVTSARISNLLSPKKRFISLYKQYVDEKNHRTIPFALFFRPPPLGNPIFLHSANAVRISSPFSRPKLSEILTIKIALPLCALSFQVPTYIFRFLLFVCFSAAGVLETYNFHRSLRQSRARTIGIYGEDEGCIGVEVRKQIKFVSRGNRKLFAFVGKVYVVLRDFAVTLTNHRLLFHFSSPLLIRLLPLTQMCSVD